MPEGIRISQITAGHAKEFHETAAGAWHPSSGRVPSSLFPGQPSRAAPVRKRRNTPAKGSFRGQSTLWEQVKIPKDAAPAPVVEMLPDGNTPAKVTPFTQHPRLSQSRHAAYQMLCPHFASCAESSHPATVRRWCVPMLCTMLCILKQFATIVSVAFFLWRVCSENSRVRRRCGLRRG